jgi:hypothetical protein
MVVWVNLILNPRSDCPKAIMIFRSKSVCPEAGLHATHSFGNQPQIAKIQDYTPHGKVWLHLRVKQVKICKTLHAIKGLLTPGVQIVSSYK